MCNSACLDFVKQNIRSRDVKGKDVLESGARNVNGSARAFVEALKPAIYIGTDIVPGEGVDQVCDAVDLAATFGEDSFDLLISTEAIEHIQDWRGAVSNFKRVLREGGVLFITTRSKGFPYHGYPADFWRYEVPDMQAIFADFDILVLDSDPTEPGVFLKARKPEGFAEIDLTDYELFSIDEQPTAGTAQTPETEVDPDKPKHIWGIA